MTSDGGSRSGLSETSSSTMKGHWPGGKRFAFTIVDDTDHATVATVKPVYDRLAELGIFTTKTVWVFPTDSPTAQYARGQTLADESYLRFVLDLKARGFEIAMHGVRGESSTRDIVQQGLERYRETIGGDPAIFVNHAHNLDNLYWGLAGLSAIRRTLRLHRRKHHASLGQAHGSPYFWGDLAKQRVRYVRRHIYRNINTMACDPFMPWHDPYQPLVNAWFSSADGATCEKFIRLLSTSNQELLEQQRGLCIVYTHFGNPGFVDASGKLNPRVDRALGELARRNGWFAPASQFLDFLSNGSVHRISGWQRLMLSVRKWLRQ